MQITADLHIHSKYSRAVSPKMNLEEIASWALKKGIQLVATGDWTHPMWMREIKTNLRETAPGLYSLPSIPSVQFILSTELSCIYSQGGKGRRIHLVVFSPSIQTSEAVIKALEKRGVNVLSDGRPILGLSAQALMRLLLEIDKKIFVVPAHIWTPWFSLFGSKSGFDSIEECFGEYASDIYGIETGLSSDPIMNWQIKELDNRSILSFSDAHSGPKLGREATVFIQNQEARSKSQKFTYDDIVDAVKQKPDSLLKIGYTIEFFPEEGKYHWSGHRACNIRYTPSEVKTKGVLCPVCKQPLTIGVENRVLDLAQTMIEKKDLTLLPNSKGVTYVYDPDKKRVPFVSLVPLQEILMQIIHSPVKVILEYERLTTILGTEFDILLRKPYEEIETAGGLVLRNAIQTVRERNVFVDPGYDGVFGIVKITNDNHHETADEKPKSTKEKKQLQLF